MTNKQLLKKQKEKEKALKELDAYRKAQQAKLLKDQKRQKTIRRLELEEDEDGGGAGYEDFPLDEDEEDGDEMDLNEFEEDEDMEY